MSAEDLTPEQLAKLAALDFTIAPVQACLGGSSATRCPLPAMHIATSVCCRKTVTLCDHHADVVATSTFRLKCPDCGFRMRSNRMFTFTSIGARL